MATIKKKVQQKGGDREETLNYLCKNGDKSINADK